MTSKKLFSVAALLLAAAFVLPACGDDDDPAPEAKTAELRVIHASYDAPPVEVLLDGQQAIPSLAYGASSGYADVDSGQRQVAVRPAAGGDAVIQATLDLTVDTPYTVFAFGPLAEISAGVATDIEAADAGKAAIRFVHASPDAPAVDIKVGTGEGPAVFSDISFKDIADYIMVDPGEVSLVVTPAGSTDVVVAYEPITLEAGQIYTAVALGTLSGEDAVGFVARVFIDTGDGSSSVDLQPVTPGSAQVMVVHASPDAPGVDLYVDGVMVNQDALTFLENTGYLELTAGMHDVEVRPAGGDTAVISAEVDLAADTAYTVFAANVLAQIEPLVLVDDLTPPAQGQAHVRFVHLSPDAPAVDIVPQGAASPLFADIEFKEATAFTPVAVGTVTLEVQLAGGGTTVLTVPDVTLEEGRIYTIFARGLVGDSSLGAELIVNTP